MYANSNQFFNVDTVDLADQYIQGNIRFIPQHIANKITSIGGCGLNSCGSLQEVIFPNCTEVGGWGFSGDSSLVNVYLPICTILHGRAFSACVSLVKISLPNVISCESADFTSCTNLEELDLPRCTNTGTENWGNGNWPVGFCDGCYSLKKVNLPLAEKIDNYGFRDCKSLVTLSLPKVKYLGVCVFKNCTSLKYLYLGYNGIVTLANIDAFENCSTNIYVPSSLVNSYKTNSIWSNFKNRIYGF